MIQELLSLEEGKTLEFKENARSLPGILHDQLPYAQAKANALDWDALQEAFAQVDKKITESKAEDLELLVKHANKVSPSYGGIILFGLNRLKIFPDARIRCVRFLGSNKSEVLDHLDIDTYPVLALEEAINFVRKNTSTRAEFGKPRRKDIPEYPAIAVREAIINAIIHADYDIKGSSIMIAIFDDRMEITNPGGIPLGMTLERALAGSSRVRNRVIARVFRELKLIEQWGSGLQRIIDACEKQGLKKPNFEDFVSEFQVTLYATKVSSVKLDASQKKLVDYLTKKKKKLISTKEAADLWDIAPRNARSKLKQLLDVGILKRVGTSANDPLGGYVLIKSK